MENKEKFDLISIENNKAVFNGFCNKKEFLVKVFSNGFVLSDKNNSNCSNDENCFDICLDENNSCDNKKLIELIRKKETDFIVFSEYNNLFYTTDIGNGFTLNDFI